jgi:AraC-like DNA-binding protein
MSAPPIPLMRAGAFKPAVDFLTSLGAATENALESVKLFPALLEEPDALIPLHQATAFAERVARSEGIEDLGLLAGTSVGVRALGAFGHMIGGLSTLFQAITMVTNGIALINSAEQLWIRRRGDKVHVSHRYRVPNMVGQRHGDAYTLTILIDIIRLAAGQKWKPDSVHVPENEIARKKRYERFFETEVLFQGDIWTVVFDKVLSSAPLKRVRQAAASPSALLAQLESTAPATDFAGSVQQSIRSLLRSGYPELAQVAEISGMSSRSFQRRLREEGIGYSQLVDRSRFELAALLLQQDRIKIIDIAFELGYNDPFNFTRAFRRWAGMSPREFRHQRSQTSPL